MDFVQNKKMAETIAINYFALHGTFPEGYQPEESLFPLCGIDLDVATNYTIASKAKKMYAGVRKHFREMKIEAGMIVKSTRKRYAHITYVVVDVGSSPDHVKVSSVDINCDRALDYLTDTTGWLRTAQLKAVPYSKAQIELVEKAFDNSHLKVGMAAHERSNPRYEFKVIDLGSKDNLLIKVETPQGRVLEKIPYHVEEVK